MSLFRTVATLAEGIDRESPMTVALVFARVASAGSAGLLQASIQRELSLPPASLTRIIQTLVALDLISRSIDNADSRHRILRLTEKGQALRDEATRTVLREPSLSSPDGTEIIAKK